MIMVTIMALAAAAFVILGYLTDRDWMLHLGVYLAIAALISLGIVLIAGAVLFAVAAW